MSYEISTVGALIGLALSIVLIMKKIPPAYGLILGAIVGGLLGGDGLTDTVAAMIEGVRDMISPVLRILTSGVLVGALIRTRSTDKIAEVIVKKCGQRHAISAIAAATMVICAIGVFIPIAVITVAPIAIAIGIRAGLSNPGILVAMLGGGKAGNIISPNPNTIAVADTFSLDLTSLMLKNVVPALAALAVTILISTLLSQKTGDEIETTDFAGEAAKGLPPLWAALCGPIVVMGLLLLRPVCGVEIDPLIALPVGGVVCILATGHVKQMMSCLEFGIGKVTGVCILLLSTGTIAGVIKASSLQNDVIHLLELVNMPTFLLAPLSGIFMACATASTTAGATIASQTFGETLVNAGVPALSAGAMIHAGAVVLDSMPHGSFFHATAGAVNMNMKDRMKIIPFEALTGMAAVVTSVAVYLLAH